MPNFDETQVRAALNGISGILVTPFDERDAIAPQKLKLVVDRAVEAGVHVLVANGNTGEYYGLRHSETVAMVRAAVDHVHGRVPLLAGVGRNIGDACDLAAASQAAGADALMVHQPPDPFVAPRGVVEYVRRIAGAASGLPVVLYLRDEAIGLSAIEDLCRIPEDVGADQRPSPTLDVHPRRAGTG